MQIIEETKNNIKRKFLKLHKMKHSYYNDKNDPLHFSSFSKQTVQKNYFINLNFYNEDILHYNLLVGKAMHL